jgi:hypothetical protein
VVLHNTMERQTPSLVQVTPALSNSPHFAHPLKGLTACSQPVGKALDNVHGLRGASRA